MFAYVYNSLLLARKDGSGISIMINFIYFPSVFFIYIVGQEMQMFQLMGENVKTNL